MNQRERTMAERKRVILLILIMMAVALIVGALSIFLLYQTALSEERSRLVETAQSQARLSEAVARFDAIYSNDYPTGSMEATLSQMRDAHQNYAGFGETGEFTLARREGELIVFLLGHRHYDLDLPQPVPFDSRLAEPMRRALSGQSGTVIGLDYRGQTVLAAYEPVAELDLGIVAKIDMAEVQAPFIRAGLIATLFALVIVIVGALVFFRVTNPLLASIEERERLYRSLIDNAPDAVFIVDGATRQIKDANPAAQVILGRSEEEITRMRHWEVVAPEDVETIRERFRRLLQGERLGPAEYHLVSKHGRRTPVEAKPNTIQLDGRQLVISFFRDITERVRAEAALRGYSERLEEMVEERTHELQEAQARLVLQEKMAALGQLAGGVGHELRNPLAAIKNAAYFLNVTLQEPEPELKEVLGILWGEVQVSEQIINSLLDYAQPKPPVWRSVDVNALVREALSGIDLPQGVELMVHLDQGLPTIQADPGQLDRVFSNLACNAVQAMPDGGVLSVDTRSHPNGIGRIGTLPHEDSDESPITDNWILVTVKDTGVGIPEGNLAKIFEPLFTTKAKGIGLGLALTRTLVEGHGGAIEVESEEGKGSTFTVRLPVDGSQ